MDRPFDKITVLHTVSPVRIAEGGAELLYALLFIVEKGGAIPLVGVSLPGKVMFSVIYDNGIEVLFEKNKLTGDTIPIRAVHAKESDLKEILDVFSDETEKLVKSSIIDGIDYMYGITEIKRVSDNFKVHRILEPKLPENYPVNGYISTVYVTPEQMLDMIKGEMVNSYHVTTFFIEKKPDYTINSGCGGLLIVNHNSKTTLTLLDIGFAHGRVNEISVEQLHTSSLPENAVVVTRVKLDPRYNKKFARPIELSVDNIVNEVNRKFSNIGMYM